MSLGMLLVYPKRVAVGVTHMRFFALFLCMYVSNVAFNQIVAIIYIFATVFYYVAFSEKYELSLHGSST